MTGCTSGRQDENLSQLESPLSNESERIDYIFLVPPGPGSLCAAAIDSGADDDGDGTATRIFADDPNPFAPTCGPEPAPICWPSDHEGAELDQWRAAKEAAMRTILDHGGTITHHHAVGRDHAPWMREEIGELGVAALRAAKERFDPNGIMNPGKLLPES